MIYNYDKIMGENPSVFYSCCNYDLVEHPIYGDEADVVAVSHDLRVAWDTGFCDPLDDAGDMLHIYEQYVEIADICNHIDKAKELKEWRHYA